MSFGRHPLARTALSLLVIGLGTAPLNAQTLESVVVSASRAQQQSFDAAAAIESVDRDIIQNAGPQVNLSESLNRVPGLTILNRQNYAQDLQVSIRGFGARSAFGIRGIRLLIDGIPATTPDGQSQGSSIALTSTDRIEVLRGPMALLYGNSAGGVIQAFTRDAPVQARMDVQQHSGSYGMRRNAWQFGDSLGQVGLVADYSTFSSSGFRHNSATERKQFNGKLSLASDEKTRLNVVFNQFDMPLAQDPAGLTATQLAADATQAGNNTVTRRVRKVTSQNQLGATLSHALDENRTVSARAYYGTRDNLQFQTGLASSSGAWVGLNRAFDGLGLQYNAQTRVAAMPLRWVAGYDFDRSREYRQGGGAALGEKVTRTRSEDNQAENSDWFAQATLLVSDGLSLSGGLRHSSVAMVSDDYFITPTDGNGSGNIAYRATSPVFGATWHASQTLNFYANYGKGFETPTLAEMAYNTTSTPAFNTSLNAASSQHYETGAKWAPDANSRVDFTAFQIHTTDEIVVASSTGGNSTFKNAPSTSRTGWELAARGLLAPHWQATLSASAIDAKYTRAFTSTSGATPITVNSGNTMPGIPRTFVFAELQWASWVMDHSRPRPAFGTQAGIEVLSTGRIDVNDTNYDPVARTATQATGYTVLNLKASSSWRIFGKGSLTAYGRLDNVTDQRYVGSVIVNQAASQFYEAAMPRNWSLGLSLRLPL